MRPASLFAVSLLASTSASGRALTLANVRASGSNLVQIIWNAATRDSRPESCCTPDV